MNPRDVEKFFRWDAVNQRPTVQTMRREILPSWLYFDQVSTTGDKTVTGSDGLTAPTNFRQPYSSVEGLDRNLGTPFVGKSLVFEDFNAGVSTTATSDVLVKMRESGEGRDFMENFVHIRTLAGTAQLPFMLREPLIIPSLHNIHINLKKLSAGDAKIRMYSVGSQYYPWSPALMNKASEGEVLRVDIKKLLTRRRYVIPIWLTVKEGEYTLSASATDTQFIKIGDDGPVQIFGWSAVSTGAFSLEIRDAQKNQTLMNGQINSTNGIGNNLYPTTLATPFLVPGGMRLRLTFRNDTAAPNTVYFTMFGRKIYAPFKDVKDVLRDTTVPSFVDQATPLVPGPLD